MTINKERIPITTSHECMTSVQCNKCCKVFAIPPTKGDNSEYAAWPGVGVTFRASKRSDLVVVEEDEDYRETRYNSFWFDLCDDCAHQIMDWLNIPPEKM